MNVRRDVVRHTDGKPVRGAFAFNDPRTLLLQRAEEAAHRQMFESVAARAFPFPAARFAGRGIVICGGGRTYFPCAWVCIKMLRHLGCTLPVELWHLGPAEMSAHMQSLVAPLGVRCVDAFALREKHPVRRLGGWELKCYALLHSAFAEVLLLDADNVPVANPAFLFDTPEYRQHGAVFWPDLAPSRDTAPRGKSSASNTAPPNPNSRPAKSSSRNAVRGAPSTSPCT